MTKPTREGVELLYKTIKGLREEPIRTAKDIEDRGERILKAFDFSKDIRMRAKNEASYRKKLDSLRSLPKWLSQIAQKFEQDEGLDALGLIDHLVLSDETKEKGDPNANTVSLMTIHSAKGLEFPYVFLTGLEEELLPHKNSASPKEIEEERRLLYVAITRAKEQLFMSFARSRATGFQRQTKKPSRFIAELPANTVSMEPEASAPQQNKEKKQEKNLRRLGDLRSRIRSGFQN